MEAERKIPTVGWPLLGTIVLLAFVIRVYRVADTPAGIFCDEASLGYNAYAIGKTGRDENASFLPLFVTSFDGYKNPIFLYAAALPVRLFGLDEASLRLTSVVFGTLTVVGIFFLALELWGRSAAFASAIFLAVTPWHIHFSRIAFELISFPALFVFGLYFLLRAVRVGGANWISAGLLLGLTLFTYAMAFPFLALFLPLFFLLYRRDVLSSEHRRWALLSALVFLSLAARVTHGKLSLPTAESYFWANTWIGKEDGFGAILSTFTASYSKFFSLDFLFRSGDLWPRHSVRSDGELHLSLLPLMAIGFLSLFAFRKRGSSLILWWCALYPVGGALLTQVPSATRGIIGAPLGALLAGYGSAQLLAAAAIPSSKTVGYLLRYATLTVVAFASALETGRFLSIYHGEYREQSARDFQTGYREMIDYFQRVRESYPVIYQTALDVNRPYIFEKFYTRDLPPPGVHAHSIRRYPEMALQDFLASPINDRGVRRLFAIRPEEKVYLEEYAVKKVIRRPDGGKEFVIVEIGRERPFFEDWAVLGPLPYPGSSDITSIPGAFTVRPGDSFAGANGEISWARPRERPALGHVSLIDLFQEDHRRDLLRDVCARATTYFHLPPGVREPVLELFSSNDWISVALNGEVVMGPMETKSHELYRAPVTPRNGWNELGIATCHDRRGWFFGARVSDGGKTVEGIETRSGL